MSAPPPAPDQAGAEAPPAPSFLSSDLVGLLGDFAETFLSTRQQLQSYMPHIMAYTPPQDSSEAARRLDELRAIRAEYDRLALMSFRGEANARAFLDAMAELGRELVATSKVETAPFLAASLQALGDALIALEDAGSPLTKALQDLQALTTTFKGAAIEDAENTAAKFDLARTHLNAAKEALDMMARNGGGEGLLAESVAHASEERQRTVVERTHLVEQLGLDLTEKVVVLNQKRVVDLSQALAAYHKALLQFHEAGHKIMWRCVLTPDPSHGSDAASVVTSVALQEAQRPHPPAPAPRPDVAPSLMGFLGSVATSLLVTKLRVQEVFDGVRDAKPSPEVQKRLDALSQMRLRFERLSTAAGRAHRELQAHLAHLKAMGEHLLLFGVKEASVAALAAQLRGLGDLHRALERLGLPLVTATAGLADLARTFRGAAIEDALESVDRLSELRTAYHGMLEATTIVETRTGQPPTPDVVADVAECQAAYEAQAQRVDAKIVLLSDLRVRDLAARLGPYLEALRRHFEVARAAINAVPVAPLSRETRTTDFAALLKQDRPRTLSKTTSKGEDKEDKS